MLNSAKLRREYRLLRGNPPLPLAERPDVPPWLTRLVAVGLLLVILGWWATGCAYSAPSVDMVKIATIESHNDPSAYNRASGAIGLCQITPVSLEDFNRAHRTTYPIKNLWDGQFNIMVADWYANIRIPQMLRAYHIKDTVKNRLWAYNAGIGRVRHGIMPKETREYVKKYNAL